MKIQFWCDNNANIHSKKTETFTLDQLGIEENDWKEMSEDERYAMVHEWAMQEFEYGFKVIE